MVKSKSIPVPKTIALLTEAISCNSDEVARLLTIKTLNIAYEDRYPKFSLGNERKRDVQANPQEVDAVMA